MDPVEVREVPDGGPGLRWPWMCPSQPLLLSPISGPSSSLACIGVMSHGGLGPEVASSVPEECTGRPWGQGIHSQVNT